MHLKRIGNLEYTGARRNHDTAFVTGIIGHGRPLQICDHRIEQRLLTERDKIVAAEPADNASVTDQVAQSVIIISDNDVTGFCAEFLIDQREMAQIKVNCNLSAEPVLCIELL